jgi:hypothetical protein
MNGTTKQPAGYPDPQSQNLKGASSGLIMNAAAGDYQPGPGVGKQAGLAITGQSHQEPTAKAVPQILNDVKSDPQSKRLQQGLLGIEGGADTSLPSKSFPKFSEGQRVDPGNNLQLSTTRVGHDRKDIDKTEVQPFEGKPTDSKGSKNLKPKQEPDDIGDAHKLRRRKQQEQEQQQQQQQKSQQKLKPLHQKQKKHLGMTFEELHDIFKTLDVNNDRSITHREFIRGLKTHRSIAAKLGI